MLQAQAFAHESLVWIELLMWWDDKEQQSRLQVDGTKQALMSGVDEIQASHGNNML